MRPILNKTSPSMFGCKMNLYQDSTNGSPSTREVVRISETSKALECWKEHILCQPWETKALFIVGSPQNAAFP